MSNSAICQTSGADCDLLLKSLLLQAGTPLGVPWAIALDSQHMEISSATWSAPLRYQRSALGCAAKLKKPRKILLDPGHCGGRWAALEEREFGVPPHRFSEGDLNLEVARQAQERLRSLGYEVALTRESPAALPAEAEENFSRCYRAELQRRVELARTWNPDLTISLHFNGSDLPRAENINGVMVFVYGSPALDELADRAAADAHLRKALDGGLPQTITRAEQLCRCMEQAFCLPAVDENAAFSPALVQKFAKISPGVFARNLYLLREIPGQVLLAEGPFMTDSREWTDLCVPQQSTRVRQYVAALGAFAEMLQT